MQHGSGNRMNTMWPRRNSRISSNITQQQERHPQQRPMNPSRAQGITNTTPMSTHHISLSVRVSHACIAQVMSAHMYTCGRRCRRVSPRTTPCARQHVRLLKFGKFSATLLVLGSTMRKSLQSMALGSAVQSRRSSVAVLCVTSLLCFYCIPPRVSSEMGSLR